MNAFRVHAGLLRDLVPQIGRHGPISGVWSGLVLLAAHGLPNLRATRARQMWVADTSDGTAMLLRLLNCPRDRRRAGGFNDYRREHQRAVVNALDRLCVQTVEVQSGASSAHTYVGPLLDCDGRSLRICCYADPRFYVNVSPRIFQLREALSLDALRVLFWLLWRHRGSRKSGPIWDCRVGDKQFSRWFGTEGRQARRRGIRALTTLEELRVLSIASVSRGVVQFRLSENYFV